MPKLVLGLKNIIGKLYALGGPYSVLGQSLNIDHD